MHRPKTGDLGRDIMIADPFIGGQQADAGHLRADLNRVIADLEVFDNRDRVAVFERIANRIAEDMRLLLPAASGGIPAMPAFGTIE